MRNQCECGNEITDTISTLLDKRYCRACLEKKVELLTRLFRDAEKKAISYKYQLNINLAHEKNNLRQEKDKQILQLKEELETKCSVIKCNTPQNVCGYANRLKNEIKVMKERIRVLLDGYKEILSLLDIEFSLFNIDSFPYEIIKKIEMLKNAMSFKNKVIDAMAYELQKYLGKDYNDIIDDFDINSYGLF